MYFSVENDFNVGIVESGQQYRQFKNMFDKNIVFEKIIYLIRIIQRIKCNVRLNFLLIFLYKQTLEKNIYSD